MKWENNDNEIFEALEAYQKNIDKCDERIAVGRSIISDCKAQLKMLREKKLEYIRLQEQLKNSVIPKK